MNQVNKETCCINIVDTPGFGDTRGRAWDLKIYDMISNLLGTLEQLNYILMVAKATENRLTPSTKFIYSQIQKLYKEDLADRMLGVFTFSDASEPQGYIALAAAGIKLADKFKFNNSSMFIKEMDAYSEQFYEMGEENFQLFCSYITRMNALPISLNQDASQLAKIQMEQDRIIQCKLKYNEITKTMIQIADLIVDAEVDAKYLNDGKNYAKFTDLVNYNDQKYNFGLNEFIPKYYGHLRNARLLIYVYIEKLIKLAEKMKAKQELYKQST